MQHSTADVSTRDSSSGDSSTNVRFSHHRVVSSSLVTPFQVSTAPVLPGSRCCTCHHLPSPPLKSLSCLASASGSRFCHPPHLLCSHPHLPFPSTGLAVPYREPSSGFLCRGRCRCLSPFFVRSLKVPSSLKLRSNPPPRKPTHSIAAVPSVRLCTPLPDTDNATRLDSG